MELAVLIVVSLILIYIGKVYASKSDPDSYHIENKQVGIKKVVFGIFAVVGGGEFIYITALAFDYGAASAYLFISFAIGCLIFVFLSDRLRRFNSQVAENRELDVYSIPDLAYLSNGKFVSALTFICTMGALGSLLLIQFSLGGEMIQILTNIPIEFSIVIMGITVGLYVFQGGFNGILVTDLIQIIALFLIFGLIAFTYESPVNTLSEIIDSSSIPDSSTFILLTIGGICWVLGGGDIWQRLSAAKNNYVAKKALLINAGLLTVFGLLLGYIGAKMTGNLELGDVVTSNQFDITVTKDNSFMALLLSLPQSIKVFVAIGLFAGLMSTADTELHTISTIISKEFSRGKPEKFTTWRTKKTIIIVAIISMILAILLRPYLIDVYLVLLNFFIILGAFMLPTLLGFGKKWTSAIGLLMGIGLFLYFLLTGTLVEGYNSVLIALPPLVFGFLGGRSRIVV